MVRPSWSTYGVREKELPESIGNWELVTTTSPSPERFLLFLHFPRLHSSGVPSFPLHSTSRDGTYTGLVEDPSVHRAFYLVSRQAYDTIITLFRLYRIPTPR